MLVRTKRKVLIVLLSVVALQVTMFVLYWRTDSESYSPYDYSKDRVTNSVHLDSAGVTNSSSSDEIDKYVHEYISEIIDDVFENKDFNTNWRLFTQFHFKEVNTDPFFYQTQRKDFHLYDPRITMSVYLNQIWKTEQPPNTTVEIPFSWQDWVDLSVLNDFLVWDEPQRPTCEDVIDHGIFYNPLKAVKEPNHKIHENFCVDNVDYTGHTDKHLLPGFSITSDNAGSQFNFLEKMIQSRSYLLSTMPQPEKLVFLTGTSDIFEVNVNHNDHSTMMENGMFDNFVKPKDNILNQRTQRVLILTLH